MSGISSFPKSLADTRQSFIPGPAIPSVPVDKIPGLDNGSGGFNGGGPIKPPSKRQLGGGDACDQAVQSFNSVASQFNPILNTLEKIKDPTYRSITVMINQQTLNQNANILDKEYKKAIKACTTLNRPDDFIGELVNEFIGLRDRIIKLGIKFYWQT